MSDETPRYEPYLNESEGHTFSLGMDGDAINPDADNETEPAHFTNPPEYDLKSLQKEERRPYSLGLDTVAEPEFEEEESDGS